MSEVERYWIAPSRLVQEGWHQDDTCVVKDWAYDRVVAERDALQQRLTAADERADVLEGLLREVQKSARKQDWASGYPTLFASVDAALKPAEAKARIQRHECSSCKGQGLRVMGGEMTECPSCDGEGFKP